MSIEAMKQALEALEKTREENAACLTFKEPYHDAIIALRTAIEQAEKQKPFGYFQYASHFDAWVQNRDSNEGVPFYTAPRQEHYDQTSLELCEKCGWRALIPGDGCLVCARQKAKPVWIPRVHLEAAQREPSMCRVEPTKRLPDFVPLYTSPRQWVGLNDQQVLDLADEHLYGGENYRILDFYKAIEAKLKEKNV